MKDTVKARYFTISAYDLAGLAEEQNSIWRGDIKLKSLRPILDKLCKELQHWSCHLRIVVPDFDSPLKNGSILGIDPFEKHHVGDLVVESEGNASQIPGKTDDSLPDRLRVKVV